MPSSFFYARGECVHFTCACSYLFVHTCTVSPGSRGKKIVVISSPRQSDTRESQKTTAPLISCDWHLLQLWQLLTCNDWWLKLWLHFSCLKLLQRIAPRRQEDDGLSGGWKWGRTGKSPGSSSSSVLSSRVPTSDLLRPDLPWISMLHTLGQSKQYKFNI